MLSRAIVNLSVARTPSPPRLHIERMTDSTFPIADLEGLSNDIYTVCYYDAGVSMQSFPTEIVGYFHVEVGAFCGEGIQEHARYKKAVRRGYGMAKSFERLVGALGNKNTKIVISPNGLVGGCPRQYHAWATQRLAFFVKSTFEFPASLTQTNTVSSTQFLHFSDSLSQTAVQSFLDTAGPRHVTILSGICLSSSKTTTMAIKDESTGELQDSEYKRATLYELEYIARSVPAIADLAIAFRSSATSTDSDDCEKALQPAQICLDIPSFHYYQSFDDHLRSGCCGFDEVRQWLCAVEKHHDQISHVFRGYLRHELLRREPSAKASFISVTPGGQRVLSSIRESIESHTRPSVEKAVDILSMHEPAWARFMQFVPNKDRPHDFRSLGYLFYVYQVARHAFGGGPEYKLERPGLLISVDDSAEQGIYSRAQKLLKKKREFTSSATPVLLETYLCPRVFVNHNASGSDLHSHDPYPGLLYERSHGSGNRSFSHTPNTSPKLHTSSSDGDLDPELDRRGTWGVIDEVYGRRTATLLSDLCAQTGLCI